MNSEVEVLNLKCEIQYQNSEVWCSKSGRGPKSESEVCPKFVWSLKTVQSPQRSLMYEAWRNLEFDFRRLSENCEVLRMSVQNMESVVKVRYSLCPKSVSETEVCQLSKSEN